MTPTSLTVPPHSVGYVKVDVKEGLLSKNGAYFQMIIMKHNDATGPHAMGVQYRRGWKDDPTVVGSKGFIPGTSALHNGCSVVDYVLVLVLLFVLWRSSVVHVTLPPLSTCTQASSWVLDPWSDLCC